MINESLLQQIEACQKCKSIVGYHKFSKTSHGNLNSKYMLLSEAPGGASIENSQYWTGSGGKLLRGVMQELDKQLEDVFYMTDIVKCWPNDDGNNRKPTPGEISNCSPFLTQEIHELQPSLILALGKMAAESVLGTAVSIKEAHGKLYESHGTKVLVMFHPSQIDFFMKRGKYTNQVRSVFKWLVNGNGADFTFPIEPDEQATATHNNQEIKMPDNTSQIYSSFILPAPGNSITADDIKKGSLRITVDFKNYFPSSSSVVSVTISEKRSNVRFEHRGGRSHLLKIGQDGMRNLNMSTGGKVKVEVVGTNDYRLSRLP